VRLGFAVIASLAPDLLITDEVLAVGDESFQRKCVRWMEDYLAGGGTLLLVSHSMYHIQKLCRRAVWLRDGEVVEVGDVHDVTQAYLAWHERKSAGPGETIASKAGLEFSLGPLELDGDDGDAPASILQGAKLHVRAPIVSREGRAPIAMVGLVRADGTPVYGVSTEMDALELSVQDDGSYVAEVVFDDLALLPGSYSVRMHVLDPEGVRMFDTRERGLTVRGESREFGLVRLAHRWSSVRGRAP
jgi:lipopolysaccharide transport system ATP-binding protein